MGSNLHLFAKISPIFSDERDFWFWGAVLLQPLGFSLQLDIDDIHGIALHLVFYPCRKPYNTFATSALEEVRFGRMVPSSYPPMIPALTARFTASRG